MVKKRTHNSTYKKLAVQWLNEALCFISSSVLADSFVIRHKPERPPKRFLQGWCNGFNFGSVN